jgi:hypothetical protein
VRVKGLVAIAGLIALSWLPCAGATVTDWCTERLKLTGAQPAIPLTSTEPLPAPDYMEEYAACFPKSHSYPSSVDRPESLWLASERTWAAEILARASADVIVVPFQVQGYGIDRAERALMTMAFAKEFSNARRLKVADPRFVSLAFGEGFRRFDPATVSAVGKSAKASFALVGYVGHDAKHHMVLTLQLLDLRAQPTSVAPQSGKLVWQRDWTSIPFSDEVPPALTLIGLLPSLIKEIPALPGTEGWSAAKGATLPRHSSFVATPIDAVTSKSGGIDQAVLLTLLGSLTSTYADLPRERLFERALLASLHRTSADRAFYTAYSLFELQQRPAALAILGQGQDPESNTLRALLNANLPDATAGLKAVKDPTRYLLLSIAVRDLQTDYQSPDRVQPAAPEELFGVTAQVWTELLKLQTDDHDPWTVNSPLSIRNAFERSFPVAGLDTRPVVERSIFAGRGTVDDVEFDIALIRHLKAVQYTLQAEACCAKDAFAGSPADLLDVFVSQIEGRISKSIELMSIYQGLPSSAIEALNRYHPILDGHPLLSLARAQAAQEMLSSATDDVRGSWIAEAAVNGRSALYYAQGQSRLARGALGMYHDLVMVEGYGYDYPLRSYWKTPPLVPPPDYQALLMQSLEFSTTQPSALYRFPPGNGPGQRGTVAAGLAGRFVGSPTRPREIPLPGQPALVETGDRLQDARAALRSSPQDWINYRVLAEAQIELTGDYAAAAATFQSYPQFATPTPVDPVATSNYAHYAATLLCYQGQFEKCTPFLNIAAELDTGSSASLSSTNLLRVLSGDYRGALIGSLEYIQRYQDASGFREALVWLHAFGQSDQAWAGFSQVMSSFDLPEVWTSALVGHRRAGLDEAAARSWMLRPEIRNAKFQGRQFAQYYAILFNATDRTPPADLANLIDQIEGEHVNKMQGGMLAIPRGPGPHPQTMVAPAFFRFSTARRPPDGTLIRSDLAMFAEAYVALRSGKFELATSEFISMADHYDIEGSEDGFALPYLAWAEAKSGDKDGIEAALLKHKVRDSFDYSLSAAFFAGARHQSDEADTALKRAFRLRPSSLYRPIQTQFQYAEACEWLYEETGDLRFRDELTDWAKKWQKVRPADAWAYAMQYTYETDPEQRLHALAMTLYLDPASARIATATLEQRARAQEWLHQNPFHMEPKSRDPGTVGGKTS